MTDIVIHSLSSGKNFTEMERFLSQCAKYIYIKHDNHLHEICLVFPNRRAGVFFSSYLQKNIAKPIIGTKITTVDELITEHSSLHQGEKLQLVAILYSIFKKHVQTAESFDDFYFWGEVLLADFNDIDRYLVSARDIFTNIADLKELELLFDYLTSEQKEAIIRFWGSLAPGTEGGVHKEKFIAIWQKLFVIYKEFREVLEIKGIGYNGMIYRQLIEQFKQKMPDFEYRRYYIIGLNALNECEKTFFKMLGYKAIFLWDNDAYYLNDSGNEAGWFLRKNLQMFPPPEDFSFNNSSFTEKKDIRLVAVSSAYGQAQGIPLFLEENAHEINNDFDNTAIVLADESLLYPALAAIPSTIPSVNVTMGYPVKNSVVFGFLLLLINLIKNRRKDAVNRSVVYHRYVTDILNHQLLGNVENEKTREFLEKLKKDNIVAVPVEAISFSALHRLIFSIPEKVEDYSSYFLIILENIYKMIRETETENNLLPELIYALYQSVEKIRNTIISIQSIEENIISETVFFRLFGQYTGQVSVPFEGEPLSGMQVMGILETRCLDFKNLIIIGLNENKWPRAYASPSFIPYNIRKGFGLPGIEEQDAMYAYYFYRLIQRAKNISATYSTLKEGISTGELSRFGFQLLYESGFNVKSTTLDFRFLNKQVAPVVVNDPTPKSCGLLIENSVKNPLSPTAINTWLQCSLRFYFRYILRLPEPEEMKDEIDSLTFGNIFHESMEQLYKPLQGKMVNISDIEKIKNNKTVLENEVKKAIAKYYLKHTSPDKPVPIVGKTVLVYENIMTFLQRLIEIDMEQAPFRLISLEKKYIAPIDVVVDGQLKTIYVGGKIDRVDSLDGKFRIIDYKTGNVENFGFNEMGELFEKENDNNKKEILQALIYCMMFFESTGENTVMQPAIYSLRRLFNENFSPDIKKNKQNLIYQHVHDEFREHLQVCLSEMLSSKASFTQTPNIKYCQYCAYRKICQRY